jgi:hypothetical protein
LTCLCYFPRIFLPPDNSIPSQNTSTPALEPAGLLGSPGSFYWKMVLEAKYYHEFLKTSPFVGSDAKKR